MGLTKVAHKQVTSHARINFKVDRAIDHEVAGWGDEATEFDFLGEQEDQYNIWR